MTIAAAFLIEFLTSGDVRPLSAMTDSPIRRPMRLSGAAVDLYRLPRPHPGRPLVLVHGLAPRGKDDPRLDRAARLFARAGFDVAVPTVPGLTRLRLRPEDREPVIAALAARDQPTVVVAVSVGAGPALLAAADPAVRDRVRTMLVLGGYASALDLVRFYLTGDYDFGGEHGHVSHDPELVGEFVAANADVLDASARRVLAERDPAAVTRSLTSLSPALIDLLARLSPERVLADVRARLILVHGRHDPAVPYTESLRLAAARPEHTRVVLVGAIEHVEGAPLHVVVSHVRDALALWSVMYALIAP